jgi:mannitol/fructose-specific phosphotransferase system IIA component (Ntr-type)
VYTYNRGKHINEESIEFGLDITDYEEAIKEAGRCLQKGGFCTEKYVDALYSNAMFYGAYAIIANNVALLHARPSKEVIKTGVGVLTLANPIKFKPSNNEIVTTLIAFCATNEREHLEIISSIAQILSDTDYCEKLYAADKEEFLRILATEKPKVV